MPTTLRRSGFDRFAVSADPAAAAVGRDRTALVGSGGYVPRSLPPACPLSAETLTAGNAALAGTEPDGRISLRVRAIERDDKTVLDVRQWAAGPDARSPWVPRSRPPFSAKAPAICSARPGQA
jgi:hypothetical protein